MCNYQNFTCMNSVSTIFLAGSFKNWFKLNKMKWNCLWDQNVFEHWTLHSLKVFEIRGQSCPRHGFFFEITSRTSSIEMPVESIPRNLPKAIIEHNICMFSSKHNHCLGIKHKTSTSTYSMCRHIMEWTWKTNSETFLAKKNAWCFFSDYQMWKKQQLLHKHRFYTCVVWEMNRAEIHLSFKLNNLWHRLCKLAGGVSSFVVPLCSLQKWRVT